MEHDSTPLRPVTTRDWDVVDEALTQPGAAVPADAGDAELADAGLASHMAAVIRDGLTHSGEVPTDASATFTALTRRVHHAKGQQRSMVAEAEGRGPRVKMARAGRWWGREALHVGRGTLRRTLAASIGVGSLLLAGVIVARTKMLVQHMPALRTYTTIVGQRAVVTLTDGSRIILAPQSRLEIPRSFGMTTRLVTLRGDALFDVAVTGRAPFTVRTGNIATRVLGTRFMVRNYGTSDTVQIVVLSGKVSTGGRGVPVTLTTGMMARVIDSTAVVTRVSDVNAYASWTHGQLVFEHTPVPTVLTTLGRWYGYTFLLGDSAIAKRRVTAAFKTSAAQETLEDLKDLLEVTLSFEGNTVTLHSRRGTGVQQAPAPHKEDNVFHPLTEVGR